MDSSLHQLHADIEDTHWWFTGRREILKKTLAHFITPPVRILEIGCGTGGNLAMLEQFGEVAGLDSSEFAVATAQKKVGCEVYCGSLPNRIPRDIGPYDVICLFDVLEHLDDEVQSLATLHSLFRANGILIGTVPALKLLWSDHDIAFGHRRRYVHKQLKTILNKSGFKILYSTYFSSFLFPPIMAIRLAKKFFPVSKNTDFHVPTLGFNRLFHTIFASESRIIPRHSFFIGSSLLFVAVTPQREEVL